jgi:peptide deformylase
MCTDFSYGPNCVGNMATIPVRGQVLEILTDDHPNLKRKSVKVDDVQLPEVQQLILDMVATMKCAGGIGLAAPQVNKLLRIMVFFLPASRDDVGAVGVPQTVIINPIITPIDPAEKVVDFEGCLSVPGVRGRVSRHKKIRYQGISETGQEIDRVAEGWHARVVQHEFDHLEGILYPELMAAEDTLLTLDEFRRATSAGVSATGTPSKPVKAEIVQVLGKGQDHVQTQPEPTTAVKAEGGAQPQSSNASAGVIPEKRNWDSMDKSWDNVETSWDSTQKNWDSMHKAVHDNFGRSSSIETTCDNQGRRVFRNFKVCVCAALCVVLCVVLCVY